MFEKYNTKIIDGLKRDYAEKRIERREFLRTSTLMGLSAAAAWQVVSRVENIEFISPANGQSLLNDKLKRGGKLRFNIRIQDYRIPHKYEWYESEIARQVIEHLTRTDEFGITKPYLLQKFTPSPDLRTWILNVRRDVKWNNGRDFTADDVIWNFNRVMDPATNSSVRSLLAGVLLDKEEKKFWDANAIEKIDSHTIKLNLRIPALAIPEYLYHYPFHIMDPNEKGEFFAGANGTGPYTLESIKTGERAVLKQRGAKYWGKKPYLDEIEFIDLGEDRKVITQALIDRSIDGTYDIFPNEVVNLKQNRHLEIFSIVSAATSVVSLRVTKPPFDNPKVRKAIKLALDNTKIAEEVTYRYGIRGENHHVAPVHPEYTELPEVKRSVPDAKHLLSEAGFKNGIEITMDMKNDQEYEVKFANLMVQQLAEAGIKLKLNVMQPEKFWEIWETTDMGLIGWGHRPLATMVLSLSIRTGGPWNYTGYSNPEIDKLLLLAETQTDPQKRKLVVERIEKILQDDGPFLQCFWRPVLTAFNKAYGGYTHHPSSYFYFNEIGLKA